MYLGLLLIADEHGRLEFPSSKYLNGRIFPNENIKDGLLDIFSLNCVVAGLIRVYKINGKNYIQIFDYKQQVRSASKFPEPPCLADDNQCLSDALQCLSPAKPSISISLSISSSSSSSSSGVEQTTPDRKTIEFNLISGEWENIENDQIEKWEKAYPACDIKMQLLKMAVWLKANPKKMKSNYPRFIANWLSRSQDKGGDIPGNKPDKFAIGQKHIEQKEMKWTTP